MFVHAIINTMGDDGKFTKKN